MPSNQIIKSIEKYITLEDLEKKHLRSILHPLKLRQNEFIEGEGEVSKYMINVSTGCLITYYTDRNATDHVMQFSTAGWWTSDLSSFTTKQPSIYSTRALVDSEILLLPKNELDELLDRFPKFEKYFRILFQNSLITHQERIIRNLSMPAEGRYQYFLEKYPTLEQFVPQKYIASYLGITPEFLSKIRRKLMEK